MKAIVVTAPGPDQPREKQIFDTWPEPASVGRHEVQIDTRFTGVTAGTERNDLVRGNYAVPEESLPSLGIAYQNVGAIAAVGDDVTEFQIGDIVFSSSPHAERVTVPETGLIVEVPRVGDVHQFALLGMMAVAVRAVAALEVNDNDNVLVVGAGFVGQIIAQVARVRRASVTICDVDERRLELARRYPGIITEPSAALQGTREYGFTRVFDTAGVPGMETQLIRWARQRGRVMFVGGRRDVSYDFNAAQQHEIRIAHTMHFEREDLIRARDLLASGQLDVDFLVDPVIDLQDAPAFYRRLIDTPNALGATVIRWPAQSVPSPQNPTLIEGDMQ